MGLGLRLGFGVGVGAGVRVRIGGRVEVWVMVSVRVRGGFHLRSLLVGEGALGRGLHLVHGALILIHHLLGARVELLRLLLGLFPRRKLAAAQTQLLLQLLLQELVVVIRAQHLDPPVRARGRALGEPLGARLVLGGLLLLKAMVDRLGR